jgi:hypothetical protein
MEEQGRNLEQMDSGYQDRGPEGYSDAATAAGAEVTTNLARMLIGQAARVWLPAWQRTKSSSTSI